MSTTTHVTSHTEAVNSRTWQALLPILIQTVTASQYLETVRANSIITGEAKQLNKLTADMKADLAQKTNDVLATISNDGSKGHNWGGKDLAPYAQQLYNNSQLDFQNKMANPNRYIDAYSQGNSDIESSTKTMMDSMQSLMTIAQNGNSH